MGTIRARVLRYGFMENIIMHRLRAQILLLPLFLTALACDDTGSAPTANNLQGPATELLDLLAAGQYGAVAQRMHFPAIYTDEQLAEDRTVFVTTLASVLEQTGKIVRKAPATDAGPLLQINVAGGDDSYWKSHPAGQGGSTVAFDVEFSKIGSGVVQIAFLEHAGVREVRSVNIGVRGSRPDARETMEGIMRGLTGAPPEDETTAQALPAAETTAQALPAAETTAQK